MTTSAKPVTSMRRARLSWAALRQNLADIASRYGSHTVLDLRGNAYGFGVETLSRIAQELGFTSALHSPRDTGLSTLNDSPHAPGPQGGWWQGAGGDVMTFEADVVSVKRVPAGSPVSYGYQYRTAQESTLALVSAGFADGVPRSASGKAQVLIKGALHPIAGRIAMDQCVVDVGDTDVAIGDTAVFWGSQPSIQAWEEWSGRSAQVLFTHLGSRVVRWWE